IKSVDYSDENMSEFSVSTMDRIIRKAAKVRVSRDAALELSAIIEEYATELSNEAIKLAKHRGAKTVNESDIRAAALRIRT
ncbi:unnamed protein product, partial [marine sediment metagenome]